MAPGDYAVLIASMRWEGTDWEGETPAAMVRCFLDASGRDEFERLIGEWEEESDQEVDLLSSEVRAPETGTNLIAYQSGLGDGSYPVWIGRDADGEVTLFMADMLILHDADALPPTVPSTAVCLPLSTPVADDRREAPFTSPGATAEFMAAQISGRGRVVTVLDRDVDDAAEAMVASASRDRSKLGVCRSSSCAAHRGTVIGVSSGAPLEWCRHPG